MKDGAGARHPDPRDDVGRLELTAAREAVAELRSRLRTDGIPSWAFTRVLEADTGVPRSRVVREALGLAGASEDPSVVAAGVRLLVECVSDDVDSGSWSTGEILARIAKGRSPDTAVRLLDELYDVDVTIPVDQLGKIADACAGRGRADLVEECFRYLDRLGVAPNIYFWSFLLRAYEMRRDVEGALATFARVPEITSAHLSTMVKVLADSGRIAEIGRCVAVFEKGGRSASAAIVARYAAAQAEESCTAALAFVRDRLASGTELRPAMLTSILRVMGRKHDHLSALALIEAVTGSGLAVSQRNLDALAAIVVSSGDPGGQPELGARLAELFGEEQWCLVLDAVVGGEEAGLEWLMLAPSGTIDLVNAGTFTALVSAAAERLDKATMRRLIFSRSAPSASDYDKALELAEASGDAELARQLVSNMFRSDVSPSLAAFERVARSYSGSLARVGGALEELLEVHPLGPPRRLAQLVVGAVLLVYAETNQANQAAKVLGKFDGWPPIESWDVLRAFLTEVAGRRPFEVLSVLDSLSGTVVETPIPDEGTLAAIMLAVARSGRPEAMRRALVWAHGVKGTKFGPRSVEYLEMAGSYNVLYGRRAVRSVLSRDLGGDVEGWLSPTRRERQLVRAVARGDENGSRTEWFRFHARPGRLGELPAPLTLRYLELAASDSDVEQIVTALREQDELTSRELDSALDTRDANRGASDLVVGRMLSSTGSVTSTAARCYIATIFESAADRTRVEAKFQAYLPNKAEGHDAEPGALLRAVSEGLAVAGKPESVRRVMKDLGSRIVPDARIWALLQRAHGDDAAASVAVVEEMGRMGVRPSVANHREVLAALGISGDVGRALSYIEGQQASLTGPEVAALLGQVVVMAASVDDLPLAAHARDLVLAIPAALPAGAARAFDAARRRAGDHDVRRLVSDDAAQTQIKLDSFVRDVAHDLNNKLIPLWVGLRNVEDILLREKDVDMALAELKEVERGQVAIRELMDHWNQVARDDAASAESADVAIVMRRLDRLLRTQFDEIGARLEYNIQPERYLVQASPYELDLLLRQLLANSLSQLRRVPSESRVVVVRAVGVDSEPGTHADDVMLSVMDSGPGIKPEHRSAIFESGFSTKAAKGVGRGLALASQVVAACDGRILVDSRTVDECTAGQTPYTEFQIHLHRGF